MLREDLPLREVFVETVPDSFHRLELLFAPVLDFSKSNLTETWNQPLLSRLRIDWATMLQHTSVFLVFAPCDQRLKVSSGNGLLDPG